MAPKQTTNTRNTVDKTVDEQVTGIDQYKTQFAQDYGNLMNQWQNAYNKPMNLQYNDRPFTTGFDPVVQQGISSGIAALNNQRAANDRATANALSVAGTGDNSGLLGVLRSQGQIANTGASNALYGSGLQQQREYDIARSNIMAQNNQTKLAEAAQRMSALAPGMGLLQQLQGMAQTAAGRTQRTTGIEEGYSRTKKSFF